MFCNLTLITVIFFLVSPKQPSRNYSSNGMQQWILNCLQATQAAHKNIIKRRMPFVLITSKLHKLKCLNTSKELQYIEMCSLGAGVVTFLLTASALLPVTVVWFSLTLTLFPAQEGRSQSLVCWEAGSDWQVAHTFFLE